MKNILLLVLALLILGGIYLYTERSEDEIVYADRQFAVEDTDEIYVITMERPLHPPIHLSRSKNGWLLNERRKASQHVVNNLLSVLKNVEIDYIPPKAQYHKVMRDIANQGVKVAVYDKKGKVLAEYTVGKNTTSEGGTFYLNKGANQPYVMRVPAVSGGVNVYFTMNTLDFRDMSIMEVKSEQISRVTLDYKRDRRSSFVIENEGDLLKIDPLVKGADSEVKQNEKILQAYLLEYKKIGAEFVRTGDPSMDSLRHIMPFAELKLEMKNGKEIGYSFYPDEQVYDADNIFRTVEDLKTTDRHFVFASDGEVYIIQQRLLKGIFKPLAYFDR